VGCVRGWTVREEMRYVCMITEIGRRGREAMQIEQTTQHSTTLIFLNQHHSLSHSCTPHNVHTARTSSRAVLTAQFFACSSSRLRTVPSSLMLAESTVETVVRRRSKRDTERDTEET
jgi:hypothetical protein